tara:strand:+ start:2704 stop:3381 length:678 start_codon:yes stop_codon:yes gene_type:complete
MRRFFLLLVFCNIVYFLWAASVNTQVVATPQQIPLYDQKALETLLLVPADREDITDLMSQQEQVISELARDKKPAKEQYCFLLGDFVDKNQAQGLADQLVNDNARVSVVSPDTYEEYWVMFPAAITWQEALKNEQMIKKQGEDDFWLIPSGAKKGAISLGLFVDVQRANNRLNELLAKKIDATIEVRARALFAVKVEIEADNDALQAYLDKLEQVKSVDITKNAC